MNKETILFYKRMLPMTILLFLIGTFLYGGISTYSIIINGFKGTTEEICIYGWGYLMMILSWYISFKTIIAFTTT